VAGNSTNINTVATDISNVNSVSGNIANVNSVAGNATNINAVNANATNINTVAGINANVTTVAGISANVTTVAGISANVTSVAGNASNINQVASDTVAINSASANATSAAASALSASNSATSASASAAAASAVALGNEPVRHSVRPSLLLDFANTKQLDPRITFTRASTGTYYDGKTVAKAEENLLLRSQDYSATWTVTNLTPVTGKTAPDGTSTATEFTASAANAVLTQGFTAIAGSYTFSVYLRRVTGTGDIQIAADNGTWNTKVITATWARYDITQTATAGAKTAGIRVVDSGDAIEVWGAQLEQRSSVTAYTVTTTAPITNYIPALQSAASGVARFEHNPTTGESLGLLIEEQRTNLVTYSGDFSNAAWVKTAATITTAANIAPDGTQTAQKLVDTTANATHRAYQLFGSSGTAYVFSCYMKAAERTWGFLNFGDIINRQTWFNLATGTIGTIGTGITASMTAVGNGWYRCTITKTASANTPNFDVGVSNADNTISYAGDGFSGIYIWGAQLEAGAFATSYIPTVASQVTRSADSASMTGTNFSSWYNNAEGTLYGESEVLSTALANSMVFTISDSAIGALQSSNLITIRNVRTVGNAGNTVNASGAAQADISIANTDKNKKQAFAYKVNDFAASVNNSAVSVDTLGTVPVGVNQAAIGSSSAQAGAGSLNGTIKKLAYYPKRLTNQELVGLTTV
jgi:hypothetical protein